MSYKAELEHAESLLAAATPNDVPHHIHYDLKLYDRDGHESTATYDIYRDPIMYQRIDVKAGSYELTQIDNLHDKVEWRHYVGDKPLKIADFEGVLIVPQAAMDRLKTEPRNVAQMHFEQFRNFPVLCANDNTGTVMCFHPMTGLFAYAQMFNQTVMYDQWLPIGRRTVPGSIRIFEDKKLIVEATGTVEQVQRFPQHLMQIPETPSQPAPETQYKLVKTGTMNLTQDRFGNLEVAVSVDEKGRVTKESIIDSDDKHLEGEVRKWVRSFVFEPKMKDGQPAPFDAVLLLQYYPS